jgi:hypothetical protein
LLDTISPMHSTSGRVKMLLPILVGLSLMSTN